MQLALGAIVNNNYTLASGDIFIIGDTNVPELIVFSASDEPISTATNIITMAQITEGTFNIVSGERSKLANQYGVVQWGIVAIESGIDMTNFATNDELNQAISALEAYINSVAAQVGNIDSVLDNIIALHNSYINGGNA